MNRIRGTRLVLGAVLVAATLVALVSVPGLVSDRDCTVPLRQDAPVTIINDRIGAMRSRLRAWVVR